MWREERSAVGEQLQPEFPMAQNELIEWVLTDTEKVLFASVKAKEVFGIEQGMPASVISVIKEALDTKRKMIRLLDVEKKAKTVVAIPLLQDSGEVSGVLMYSKGTEKIEEDLVLELLERMNQEQTLENALKVMTEAAVRVFNLKIAGVWLWNNRWFQELALTVKDKKDKATVQKLLQEEMDCHRELIDGQEQICVIDLEQDTEKTQLICFDQKKLLELGVKKILCIRLTHLGTFLGVLGLFSPDANVFTEQRLAFIKNFAPIISSYVHVKQLREAATEREQALNLLLRGTEILVQAESEEQLLTEAGEMTMIFYIEAGFFLLKGEEGWKVCAPFGRLRLRDQGQERWVINYVGLESLESYEPQSTPQVKLLDVADSCNDFPWTKAIILPIKIQGEIGGELWLLDYRENQIEQYQEIFAAFTRGLGVALDTIRQRQELERMAMTDVLTGLLNRKGFEARINEELASTLRRRSSLLLLIIDLDGFKNLNDTFGHPAGDHALSQISNNLRASVRQNDIVARTGGDEFSVVLTDLNKSVAYSIIERIRQKMGLEHFGLGASIGVAEYPTEADTFEKLYKISDRRLYYSKHHGKGKIVLEDMVDNPEQETISP